MKNLLNDILFYTILIGGVALLLVFIWFAFMYILVFLILIFVLFGLNIIPITVTHKDGSEEKFKLVDLIKKIRK